MRTPGETGTNRLYTYQTRRAVIIIEALHTLIGIQIAKWFLWWAHIRANAGGCAPRIDVPLFRRIEDDLTILAPSTAAAARRQRPQDAYRGP